MKERVKTKKVSILLVISYFCDIESVLSLIGYLKKDFDGAQITISGSVHNIDRQKEEMIKEKYRNVNFLIVDVKSSKWGYIRTLRKKRFKIAAIFTENKNPGISIEKARVIASLSGAEKIQTVFIDNVERKLKFEDISGRSAVYKTLIPDRVLSFVNIVLFCLMMLFFVVLLSLRIVFNRAMFLISGAKRNSESTGSEVLEKEDIVCFSTLDWWGDLYQRPHHIFNSLGKDNRVLFVGPSKSIKFEGNTFISVFSLLFPKRDKNNIFVYNPVVVGEKVPLFSEFSFLNKILLKLQMLYTLERLDFKNVILFVLSPGWGGVEDFIKKKIFCYDCFDKYETFGHMPKEQTKKVINALLRKADIVLASAGLLYEDCKIQNSNTFLVPNAVGEQFFAKSGEKDILGEIKSPIVGYHGVVADWVDLSLIEHFAAVCPEVSVVLIGPIQCEVEALRKYKNIHFLGKRDYKVMPGYVNAFDVGIIPFKVNDLTTSVNPLKVYEYMSLGKPVVSVDIPEVRQFGECVSIARSKEEFVEHVRCGLREEDVLLKDERINIALQNGWSTRSRMVSELLKKEIIKKETM